MSQPTPPDESDSEEYQRGWWDGWIAHMVFAARRQREMDDEQ